MNTRVEPLRAGLAILTTLGLVIAMMMVFTGPAGADHIDETGTVQGNCVEFQVNATGTLSPSDYDGSPASENDVNISLDSWDSDDKGFTFTVSGLLFNQHVDISIKSGTDIEEPGPFGNGTHHVDNTSSHEISHVRICVFEDSEATTTTTEATTTTSEATTTTSEATTTTVASTTPTTAAIQDDVLGTVITAPTSTVADEVAGTQVEAEELPFTGPETGWLFPGAILLLISGLMITALAGNSRED